MEVRRFDEDPIGYLIDEMEIFILKMASEIDRLRARIKELEGVNSSPVLEGKKVDRLDDSK